MNAYAAAGRPDKCANCLRPKAEHAGNLCPRPYTTVWSDWDYEDHIPAQQQPVNEGGGLTDEQIIKIAETLGKHEPGVSNYDSWGPLGYRLDDRGECTIPVVPRNVIPFARAVLALAARTQAKEPLSTSPASKETDR